MSSTGIGALRPETAIVWGGMALQITPSNGNIAVSLYEFIKWTPEERACLLEQYKSITGFDGMYVQDAEIPRVFLGPVSWYERRNLLKAEGRIPLLKPDAGVDNENTHIGPGPQPANGAPVTIPANPQLDANGNRIKRPANPFILFRQCNHPMVVAANPGISNIAVSAIIGKMWENKSVEEANYWKLRADQLKIEHALKYPGYRFQPRRSSEIKQRKRRQARNLTASANVASTFADIPQHFFTATDNQALTVAFPLANNAREGIAARNGALNHNAGSQAPNIVFRATTATQAVENADRGVISLPQDTVAHAANSLVEAPVTMAGGFARHISHIFNDRMQKYLDENEERLIDLAGGNTWF